MRIAVLGAGRWGTNIIRVLLARNVDVIAIDPDATARAVAEALGARSTALLGDLDLVDAAVVATPATTHRDTIDTVWPREIPIFCEKPLTTDTGDARALAERDDGRLFVMHIWRYHPGVEMLARLAASGELGDVHGIRTTRTNWTSPRTDTDAIWTLAPHDLTLAIEILGHIPTPRAAIAEHTAGRPSGLWAHCNDTPGPWLVIEASTRFADKRREIRLHAEHGVAVLGGLDATDIEIAAGTDLVPAIERRPFEPREPLAAQLDAFCSFVRGGPRPKSDVHEGLAVVAAVDELRRLAGVAR